MQNSFVVIGLGYGDEGKGTIVDYMVQKHGLHTTVRFNGGSQAAHHVLHGRVQHCFSQFGSGTLVEGVNTLHSKYMMIDPVTLEVENNVLAGKGITDCLDRLTIDAECLVITPFNVWLNRMAELSRGDNRHGSCGRGIGETASDGLMFNGQALYVKDLLDFDVLSRKLRLLWLIKLDKAEQLAKGKPYLAEYLDKMKWVDLDALAQRYHKLASRVKVCSHNNMLDTIRQGNVVFEGAQGVLLDQEHGFAPYTTWSRTTFRNADLLLDGQQEVRRLGVVRAYVTRHGNGPFVTEEELDIQPCHNKANEWQGSIRTGWFDVVAIKYALSKSAGINGIALTSLDRLSGLKEIKVCTYYQYKGSFIGSLPRLKGEELTPVVSCCRPVYETFPGWDEDISTARSFSQLPENAKNYVLFLEQALNTPITIISVGPKTDQKFERRMP